MTLKELRASTGKTATEVARELGLSSRQMYRLEEGSTPGKRLHWLALSAVYGVPVTEVEEAARQTAEAKR